MDADCAALWAVNTVMDQVMPMDEQEAATDPTVVTPKPFVALGETIRLSEAGFDSEQFLEIDTFEAFQHWNQLMLAVDRLHQFLEKA
jgi:hypothetical protein